MPSDIQEPERLLRHPVSRKCHVRRPRAVTAIRHHAHMSNAIHGITAAAAPAQGHLLQSSRQERRLIPTAAAIMKVQTVQFLPASLAAAILSRHCGILVIRATVNIPLAEKEAVSTTTTALIIITITTTTNPIIIIFNSSSSTVCTHITTTTVSLRLCPIHPLLNPPSTVIIVIIITTTTSICILLRAIARSIFALIMYMGDLPPLQAAGDRLYLQTLPCKRAARAGGYIQ